MVKANDLRALLTEATRGVWIENGTLIGPTMHETDASTDEDEPSAWITFKTPQPDIDRKLWILLRNNAEGLLRLWQAAESLESMLEGHPDLPAWTVTRQSPIFEALAQLKAGAPRK